MYNGYLNLASFVQCFSLWDIGRVLSIALNIGQSGFPFLKKTEFATLMYYENGLNWHPSVK